MIIMFLLNVFTLFVGALFSWLPTIETLPSILGVDIDAYLVLWTGMLRRLLDTFWPFLYMINGALVILAYFSVKMIIKFFLGNRAP